MCNIFMGEKSQNIIEGVHKWRSMWCLEMGSPLSPREQVSQNESRKASAKAKYQEYPLLELHKLILKLICKCKNQKIANVFGRRTHLDIKL